MSSVLLIQVPGIGIVVVLIAVALFVIFLVGSAVRIVNEYERGVIFRLGRVLGAKGPGLFFLVPIVDRMVKIDLRTVTMDVPPQDLITRDNVPARVNAVVYFRVLDPNKSVLGQKDLDDLLTDREAINEELQTIIDEQTDPWGVKVSVVEVKDVEIPQGMQRSMAGQAEAERERRAKIIAAEGEYQASQRLKQAADRLESPTALQLRLFQTLTEVASENNSTIILPVPIDLFRPYLEASNGSGNGHVRQPRARRREEEEAERLYEEAVGEARSEQQAAQELAPDGSNPDLPTPSTPVEDATALHEERTPSVEPAVPGEIPHEDMVPPTPPPPRGTLGDAQRGTSPEPAPTRPEETPRAEEGKAGREKTEEDKGLVDKAKDHLRGE